MNEVSALTLPLQDSQPTLTSGTVGTTVIDTISVIESAIRRCGLQPATTTPEDLDTAKNNLFMLLSALVNSGFNLWAIDQFYLPMVSGQARYALPESTEGIAGIIYRTTRRLEATTTLTGTTGPQAVWQTPQNVSVLGFKLNAEQAVRFVIETTQNGTTWDEVEEFDLTLRSGWHWYTFTVTTECVGVRLRDLNDDQFPLADLLVSNTISDAPLTSMNRDDYTLLNNKFSQGVPNQYYFEKKIESAISFWPVPSDETNYVVLWRHRAIQDVGSLTNKLEIPNRWFNAITWMLAKNLAYELKGVAADRIQLVSLEAEKAQSQAELGESDGAPMFIKPNISGYTS